MTKEEVKEIFDHNWTKLVNPDYLDDDLAEAQNWVIEALSAEPQIGGWEVYEVLHGEWEGTKKYRCPRCKHKVGVFNTNFCPECGLKMSNGKSWERSNMKGDNHE